VADKIPIQRETLSIVQALRKATDFVEMRNWKDFQRGANTPKKDW
jgi:hypothetical protein